MHFDNLKFRSNNPRSFLLASKVRNWHHLLLPLPLKSDFPAPDSTDIKSLQLWSEQSSQEQGLRWPRELATMQRWIGCAMLDWRLQRRVQQRTFLEQPVRTMAAERSQPPDSPAGAVFTGLTRVMLGQSYGFKQIATGYRDDFLTLGLKSVAIQALIPFNKPNFVPQNWVQKELKIGDGVKYQDPNNPHNEVPLEKAKPGSSNPGQQNDYMKVLKNGQWLDANGKALPNQSQATHIPQGTELPPDTFGPIPECHFTEAFR
jgi:hypothetical protein